MAWSRPHQAMRSLAAVRLFATSFVVMCSTAIFVNDNLLEITPVRGPSMAPTLSPASHATGSVDYLLSRKWAPTRKLARGDVVLLASPNHPDVQAVKRVIALEGDTVILDPRRCPPPTDVAERAWRAWRGRVVVPPGHVWVEGDNWRSSSDSNYYGPLSRSLITGTALCIVSPWERFGARPWENWKGQTRVRIGTGKRTKEWTIDGMPVDLVELGVENALPPALQTLDEKALPGSTSDRNG